MRRIGFAIILLVSLSAPAWADFQDAVAAVERGDYATALQEFKPLAERGDTWAQFNLGEMYFQGEGVPQDYAEAVRWYLRAAGQGLAEAQNNLGDMYHRGYGVPQDYVQAHMWFNLAATRLPPDRRFKAVWNRDLVAAEMTPEQIAEAQRLAREWKPKSE